MATAQLSAGVVTIERDLTGIVPGVSTTAAAIAGVFDWGPVGYPYRVSNEAELANVFGKPTERSALYFFSAANFLSYASNLLVNRAELKNARNASGAVAAARTGTISVVSGDVTVMGDGTQFETELEVGDALVFVASGVIYRGYVKTIASATSLQLETASPVSDAILAFSSLKKVVVNSEAHYEQMSSTERAVAGLWAAKFPGSLGNSLTVSIADSASFATWDYKNEFTDAPGTSAYAYAINQTANDEIHVVVVDDDGSFGGVPGAVIEKFAFLSKASDATQFGSGSNYFANVINRNSRYVWWMSHPTSGLSVSGVDFGSTVSATEDFKTITTAIDTVLANGDDGGAATSGEIIAAYEEFENSETYDFSLLISGPAGATVATELVSLAETRQDIVVFLSPVSATGGPIIGSTSDRIDEIVAYRKVTLNVNSSFAFMDSGWKYQYDKYNDIYRWVPLNGDIAGLTSRSDEVADAWKSPAGFNRGQLKNVVKLGVNPNKAQRDVLYSAGVNPVVSFPGQGVILYGDKTLSSRPSAFDRINVRRLFIVLRKAIARAAQYQLFENNTASTRAQFRAYVEPFLREVQGREGITAFKVVCDTTNNTPDVIMRNEFRGEIMVQPAYSINFIQLTFSAVRSDVSFQEVTGG